MDKAEPLKDRDIYAQYVQAEDFDVKGIHIFTDSAVKSAVEWLKKQIDITTSEVDDCETQMRYIDKNELDQLINIAFNDVIKGD